jgi:hypothetical protein
MAGLPLLRVRSPGRPVRLVNDRRERVGVRRSLSPDPAGLLQVCAGGGEQLAGSRVLVRVSVDVGRSGVGQDLGSPRWWEFGEHSGDLGQGLLAGEPPDLDMGGGESSEPGAGHEDAAAADAEGVAAVDLALAVAGSEPGVRLLGLDAVEQPVGAAVRARPNRTTCAGSPSGSRSTRSRASVQGMSGVPVVGSTQRPVSLSHSGSRSGV